MTLPAIRPYRSGDLADLYRVCLQTGESGEDATALFQDPQILGHCFAAPYGIFEPTLAYVAEDELGVGGYIVGALDTRAFEQRLEAEWWPSLRERYAPPPPELAPEKWTRDQLSAHIIYNPLISSDDLVQSYPSHLHINLVARLQSQGLGRKLMNALLQALRERGSSGVHFFVNPANQRAASFYRHLGFTQVAAEDVVVFAMDLHETA